MSAVLAGLLAAAARPGPLGPECPWYSLLRYGPPNVDWCEATICAAVNEPANAWSNLAYLLVAAWIFVAARPLQAPALRRYAATVAAVGVGSFIYHASNLYVTQILDFFGMYLMCFLLLGLNLQRLGVLRPRAAALVLPAAVVALTALTVVLGRWGFPIQAIVGLLILGVVVSEVVLYRRARPRYPLARFLLGVALLNAGALCSVLDVTRRLCDPENHLLQGHAVWHVLSAASLGASFTFFRQFDEQLRDR